MTSRVTQKPYMQSHCDLNADRLKDKHATLQLESSPDSIIINV
jgi:hypothetical protein